MWESFFLKMFITITIKKLIGKHYGLRKKILLIEMLFFFYFIPQTFYILILIFKKYLLLYINIILQDNPSLLDTQRSVINWLIFLYKNNNIMITKKYYKKLLLEICLRV